MVSSFANQALDSLLGVYSMDIPVHIGNATAKVFKMQGLPFRQFSTLIDIKPWIKIF